MLNINIDFQGFIDTIAQDLMLTQDKVDDIVDKTLDEVSFRFAEELKINVGRELSGAREEYIKSIYHVRMNPKQYEVGIRGWFPNAIENGASAFDMKEGFSKSNKINYTKDGGWYLTVPFRHATSGAVATSSVFSNTLPKPVAKAVQETFKAGSKQIKDTDIPLAFRKAKEKVTNRGFYKHKSSIYKGMIHSDKKNHGSYTTFRRVGSKSDDASWQHPGLVPRHFFEKTLSKMQVDKIVDNFVRNFI
jgi:hypothetical protein